MIDIKTKKRKAASYDGEKEDHTYMIVNGISDKDSFLSEDSIPHSYSHFYKEEVIKIITAHSFNDVGQIFVKTGFDLDVDWWEYWLDIQLYCSKYYDTKIPRIRINLQIQDWEHWANPWSISTLAKHLQSNIKKLKQSNIRYWAQDGDDILNGFGVEYFPSDGSSIVNVELSKLLIILKGLVDKTNKDLLLTIDKEAVLTYFQFPEEIKTACKQYLVYFTQFIADLGIIVDTELKEELNHTLFKIIPKDKNESLEKIREALNIYLNSPSDKNFQAQIANQTDIAAKQWESNYFHLKSQLALATSIIQAKDSAIEMLQLSNYQYKQLLETQATKKDSDKEDIVKGIISVKKYEGKGFSIDLAEIFRRLKRTVKK